MIVPKKQIDTIKNIFQDNRENAEEHFHSIMEVVEENVQHVNIEIKIPRLTNIQQNRSNVPCDSPESYYRRCVFIPYLDSLITSLSERFSEENEPAYLLFQLHPNNMRHLAKDEYENVTKKNSHKIWLFFRKFWSRCNGLVRSLE